MHIRLTLSSNTNFSIYFLLVSLPGGKKNKYIPWVTEEIGVHSRNQSNALGYVYTAVFDAELDADSSVIFSEWKNSHLSIPLEYVHTTFCV